MPCEPIREKIQAFVDGELPEDEIPALREHCMSCPSCAKYLREMLALQKAVRELGEEPVPNALHGKIMTAYKREKRGFLPWIRRNPAIAAAAVLVVLVGTVYATGVWRTAAGTSMVSLDAKSIESVQDTQSNTDNRIGYAVQTTVAGAATEAHPSTTAAALATTTEETTAAQTTAESDELRMLREEAEKKIPDLPITESYSFVSLVKAESIPVEFHEWTAYADQEYDGEIVTILCAIVSKDREKELIALTQASESYYCDDASVYPKLSVDAENGLFIMIVPQGA